MKTANLRVCASCKWIFELKNHKECPKCGFAHYSAYYVYGKKCYKYKLTQEPWIEQKVTNYTIKLYNEIDNYNKKFNKEKESKLKWKDILNIQTQKG
jgi:hypothetical protein